MECEVIRDLLPSYVDGLCSARSRELVEEHRQMSGQDPEG